MSIYTRVQKAALGLAQLTKTGQTITYRPIALDDDGALELGIAHDFIVLTTGQYSGTVNITVNGKTHATSNACVKDKNTGLMFHREVIQANLGPAGDGKLFWEHWALGPVIDISFDAATKIINSVAGDFNVNACCVGRKITISGAAQAGNNQDVTIAAITTNNMTVNEVIVNEGAGASVSFVSADDLIWDLKDQANATALAGYSDWRIPNWKELNSIIDSGNNSPCIDVTVFPSVPVDSFWVSSSSTASNAGYIYFQYGQLAYGSKSRNKQYIRLVRN